MRRREGTRRGLGPHASRRGLLRAGLAIGTLALGERAALGQSGGGHVHMPELGVANLRVVPVRDQPLVEPEVRRSVNGVLSTSLRCAYAYRDIGGMRPYLRTYEGGLGPTLRMKPGETLKIRLINDLPPNRDMVPSNPSHPHQLNNTNFHFHGAQCSPSGIADNVMRWCPPSRTTSRSHCLPITRAAPTGIIRITTARPMCRSRAAWQAPSSSKATSPPEIARARERVMLLSQVVFDAFNIVEDFGTLFPETATRFWP